MRPPFFALLLSSSALLSCASAPTSLEEDPLIGGKSAGRAYGAVGALFAEDGVFCTATLVAPQLVITAKHCIQGGSEEEPEDRKPESVELRLGAKATAPAVSVKLRRWLPEPEVANATSPLIGDVALAELARPITTVAPITLSLDPITEREIGADFDVVGFGVRRADGLAAPAGRREVGTFVLEAVTGNAFLKRFGSRPAFDAFYGSIDPDGAAAENGDRVFAAAELHEKHQVLARSVKSETCFADSGGPLLRKRAGTLEVVGVVSSGFPGFVSSCLHLGTVFGTFGPSTRTFLEGSLRPAK
jgi:secreted trypsin-like serine protease